MGGFSGKGTHSPPLSGEPEITQHPPHLTVSAWRAPGPTHWGELSYTHPSSLCQKPVICPSILPSSPACMAQITPPPPLNPPSMLCLHAMRTNITEPYSAPTPPAPHYIILHPYPERYT